ncbi:MAG: CpaF family protein [Eggerthellaceae bacterium]|nr:CpaF family protein [Eggerthellaceae bacterium]
MSLLERSRKNAVQVADGAPDARGEDFARLRNRVQEILSAASIAELYRENAARAKSEVRAACRQAFAEEEWLGCNRESREALTEAVLDSMFGFGPLEGMLADDTITEIMVNGSRQVFFERDGVVHPAELQFVDEAQVRVLIDRILGPLRRRIDEASPMVDARLPQGHRVNAVIPPIAPDGPVLTIRKFATRVLTLEDLQAKGCMSEDVRTLLVWAVRARKSIAVSGGTGAGKTTLLNALSCCIPESERIITIEDSAELRFLTHPDVVRMEARPANAEGRGRVAIRDLVMNALRMRPDRIVVGECRGPEALDMLQAMNTGHEGSLTTLHANSPGEVVSRLTTMVRYAADIPVEVVEAYIARALDVVVQMTRGLDGRRYISQVACMSYDEELRRPVVEPVYRVPLGAPEGVGEWLRSPSWVDDLPALGVATAEEVEAWKRHNS